jgi:hypothetical protein
MDAVSCWLCVGYAVLNESWPLLWNLFAAFAVFGTRLPQLALLPAVRSDLSMGGCLAGRGLAWHIRCAGGASWMPLLLAGHLRRKLVVSVPRFGIFYKTFTPQIF